MTTGPGEMFGYFLKEDPDTLALPLPLVSTDRLAVVRGDVPDETTYYLEAGNLGVVSSTLYVIAVDAGTTNAPAGTGCVQLEPVGALASYTIVLPPTPADEQVFEVWTTQDITDPTIMAPGFETVLNPSPGVLPAQGRLRYRYRELTTTWY